MQRVNLILFYREDMASVVRSRRALRWMRRVFEIRQMVQV